MGELFLSLSCPLAGVSFGVGYCSDVNEGRTLLRILDWLADIYLLSLWISRHAIFRVSPPPSSS